MTGVSGVTGRGKGKGAGSTIVGVGGSEIGGSGVDGHGGVEGAEVDVDVMLDSVGAGVTSGFGGIFGGIWTYQRSADNLLTCQSLFKLPFQLCH